MLFTRRRRMILTSVYICYMVFHMAAPGSSVGAVRTGERLLSCVNSQVGAHGWFVYSHEVADPTLVSSTGFLSMGIKTLHRSQRQLTERALRCRTATVSGSCISRCWAEIWRDNRKSSFRTIRVWDLVNTKGWSTLATICHRRQQCPLNKLAVRIWKANQWFSWNLKFLYSNRQALQ